MDYECRPQKEDGWEEERKDDDDTAVDDDDKIG